MPAREARLRRVYDEPIAADGTRVLVDRLWPRGLSKADAQLDQWCKDIAPSTELRVWYHHDPQKFENFTARYLLEIEAPERAAALTELRRTLAHGPLTLLTATRELDTSHAHVLVDLLREP